MGRKVTVKRTPKVRQAGLRWRPARMTVGKGDAGPVAGFRNVFRHGQTKASRKRAPPRPADQPRALLSATPFGPGAGHLQRETKSADERRTMPKSINRTSGFSPFV